MGLDIFTLGSSKTYTRESLLGGGAVVGKNVIVSSITSIEGGNRVTFSYTLDNGTIKTSTMDVMDGKDGQGSSGGSGEENKIEVIKVNGVEQTVAVDKSVEITVPSIEGLASEIWVNEQGFLTEHQDISNLVQKEDGKGLSSNDYTTEEKDKLTGLENYDDTELDNRIKVIEDDYVKSVDIPTKVSDLANDSNFQTADNITAILAPYAKSADVADLKAFVGYTDDDIYGVEVDFKNKKFTRLAGAVNRTPGAAFDAINAFGGRKRCNVDNSGNVIAYYGDAGFSTTGKLTQAVTVGEGDAAVTYASGTIVQVMVEQPKFYYKVVPLLVEKKAKGSITRKVRYYVSDTAKAGFKLHPAFIVNGQENEKIYVSAFEGSLWDASASTYILDDSQVADFAADMLSSIANAKPMSGLTQNLVRSNVRKLAEKRGTGWEQATVQTAAASELLMLIEYASFNMQSAIGQGVVNKTDDGSSNMAENTGVTITLGNGSGTASNSNGVQFVTYRGEENFWGNIWKWVDGLNQYFDVANKTSTIYIADHGFTDDIGTGVYEDAGIIPSLTNGYVSAFCYSEDYDWLFIAGEVVGDSSLPVGDYFWQTTTTGGWRVARLGASWSHSLYAGAFFWGLDSASSDRNRSISGRLVYRKKVVSAV